MSPVWSEKDSWSGAVTAAGRVVCSGGYGRTGSYHHHLRAAATGGIVVVEVGTGVERDPGSSSAARRARVTLVDAHGTPIGETAKLAAHEPPGQLHLAFSVFLYDGEGRLLLQRRAASKYHFPRVWANTCCSHPAPGEDPKRSAEDRVQEELGLSCSLELAGQFVYRATCPSSGLVEHEYDLVFVGELTGTPVPDPDEVEEVRLLDPVTIADDQIAASLAPWFGEAHAIATAFRPRPATRR